MPSIRQTSNLASTIALFLLALLVALAAAMALGPAAGLAEPGEEPQLSFDPASHDFGLQPVYSGSQATLQLRNDGGEAVLVEPLQVAGPGSDAYWAGGCGWTTLQPGETCFAQVNFNPQHPGDFPAELRASVGGHQFTAQLSGEGGQALLAPASNPIDFGTTAVGSPGVTREIEISNVGNLTGGVFIAVISGGAVGSFQLLDENCTGVPLAPAATCTVQVRFRPLSEGAKKATLSLFGESDGGAQVILSGMGSAPAPAEAQFQGQSAAPGSSVTSIVRKTTHRITRPQRRRAHRRQGLRHHRRAGLARANRIP